MVQIDVLDFIFEVSGLCFLMDHTYTKHQLLRMERKVLCGLKFDLSFCSPLHFLILFAAIAHCSDEVDFVVVVFFSFKKSRRPEVRFVLQMVWMARYLLELSLLESQCVPFLPVHLAGAALCLARQVLQAGQVPPTPEGEAAWCLASSLHIGRCASRLKLLFIV